MSELRLLVECVSERDFRVMVMSLAKRYGWLVSHNAPAQVKGGRWITNHSAGVPDLLLVRDARLIFAELKRLDGRLSEPQRAWLSALQRVEQVETYLWTPRDWSDIQQILEPE